MAERTCAWPDCSTPISKRRTRGYCDRHRKAAYRAGIIRPQTSEERFWAKVTKVPGGCWLWTGSKHPLGYGTFTAQGRSYSAHVFAYKLLVGPVPEGKELDHVKINGCISTSCVKAIADEYGPTHLEPVTHLENVQRGDATAKGTCRRGHDITDPANRYERKDRPGYWNCRACTRERWRARHQ